MAIVFELFTVGSGAIPIANEFNNITLSFAEGYDIKAFTPPITVSTYNHYVVLSSVFLFCFGFYSVIKNGYSKKYMVFLFLQCIYFLSQVLGFIIMGLYPVPAFLMALFAGGALYNFGMCLLKCNK